MTLYKTAASAKEALENMKFFSFNGNHKGASLKSCEQLLNDYSKIAEFLCSEKAFNAAMEDLSIALWHEYKSLPKEVNRNMFTRCLGKIATRHQFTFQDSVTLNSRPCKILRRPSQQGLRQFGDYPDPPEKDLIAPNFWKICGVFL